MNPIVDLINAQQANIDTQKTFTLVLKNTGNNLEKLQLFGTLEEYMKVMSSGGKTYTLQKTTKSVVDGVVASSVVALVPSFPRKDQMERFINEKLINLKNTQTFNDIDVKCELNPDYMLENKVTGLDVDNLDIKAVVPNGDVLFDNTKNYLFTTEFMNQIANADLNEWETLEYGFAKYSDTSVFGVSSVSHDNVISDVQLVETGGSGPISSNIIVDGNFNENLNATAILPEKTIAGLWNYLLSKELTLKGIQFKLENGVQANNNQFVELYEYSPFLTEPNFVKNIQAYKNGYQRQANIYDIFGLNWQLDKLKYLTIPNFQGTTVITLFF